uniref:Uncharacterized protein n=1 Tax=Triticum urartu TaxID=4572 RepID=A0A8R7K3P3_TRIUA
MQQYIHIHGAESISFLDESGQPEDEVPDVAEVPPFERPPFPAAHGVGRRRPPGEPPPPLGQDVRRHVPLCVVGASDVAVAAVVVATAAPVGRRPGARPPLPVRHGDRGRQLRRG